jgi:acyl-CoA thioesterase FadM
MSDQSPVRSHQTCFRVRYAETDQMGVVYYANYLVWMELGRAEYAGRPASAIATWN